MSWLNDDDDDPESFDAWDESDVRVRPNPKGNKPRSKIRPSHQDAVDGRVLSVDRGRYTVLIDEEAVARGMGLSKKQAEQQAAERALVALGV